MSPGRSPHWPSNTPTSSGWCWPSSVAPADVHLVAAGKEDQLIAAEKLAKEFAAAGVSVLLDDRAGVSVGVKFKDAELIGVPLIVVVGRRAGRRPGRGPEPGHW